MSLRGRTALVTGAGRGLGRATALRLARDGADIVAIARTAHEVDEVAAQARQLGVRAVSAAVDVGSADAVGRLLEQVRDTLGPVDIVVNNAGNLLYKPFVPLPGLVGAEPGFDTAISDAEWASVLRTHLGGAINVLRAVAPSMLDRRCGRIVNVVSNVVRRTVPFTVAYDTAKGALVQLTRSLAREWGPYGITVNAVAAGHFPTSMTTAQFADEKGYQRMLKRIPVGRTGHLDEFAALVSYLVSANTGFLTGEVIAIDGGETL